MRPTRYEHKHENKMSTPAVAQLLSTTLYGRRFFPYYTFNVVGGLDKEGTTVMGCCRARVWRNNAATRD